MMFMKNFVAFSWCKGLIQLKLILSDTGIAAVYAKLAYYTGKKATS